MKKLLYALLGLLGVFALALLLGRWWLGRSVPDYDAEAQLAGLGAPVEVWRDSLGVPHVWARSEADLYRAMGWVHAQDRLWQMELFRRVADGRLAEVLGADVVDTDRFLRTVGMGRAAGLNEERLPPDERALLQAYADGVNAWLAANDGPLPPEFVALRLGEVEPWTVRNTLSIAKIMAWDLADWNVGLDVQRAVDAVGAALAADVHPLVSDSGVTILGADARWDASPDGVAPPAPAPDAAAATRAALGDVPLPRLPETAARLLETVSVSRASNAWVIGGSRTASGKPIVANDTHLALRAPSVWYLAALHAEGVDVAGFTIPGVPVVVIGHSRAVAWGYTNAMVDDVDFFVEQVDPSDSTRYRIPQGWAPFDTRREILRVKGGDSIVHTVRASRHGPILSDVEPRAGDRVLAMRWTAHDPSTEVTALRGMNRARDAAEFTVALRAFDNPHQNVVFADTAGAFGYWMGGRVPVRRSGDGVLPVAGWTDEGAWVRYLDFGEHPHVLNPASGYVVTANNRQVGDAYPHLITRNWAEPYRAQRITEMVAGGVRFTADDVARQQMDVRDAFAARYRPFAVRAARAAGDTATLRLLEGWDGTASVDSRPASVFYTWFDVLRRRIGHDEYGEARPYFPRSALERVLNRNGGAWVDDVTTDSVETLDGQMAAALREAVETVAGRPWGDLHQTRIEHAMGRSGALDRALGLNIGPFPSPGAYHTVNVAGWSAQEPPFLNIYGPSQRHVVDMADVDGEGGFILPSGQSGNPFSHHYRDQTAWWRAGRLWRLPLERDAAEARTVHRTTLRP